MTHLVDFYVEDHQIHHFSSFLRLNPVIWTYLSLDSHWNRLFLHNQCNAFDVEGHYTAEIIPALFCKGSESGLACALMKLSQAKVLPDLVSYLGDKLVPLYLKVSKSCIDKILSHNAVSNIIVIEKDPVEPGTVPLVRIHPGRKTIPMNAFYYNCLEVVGIMFRGLGYES